MWCCGNAPTRLGIREHLTRICVFTARSFMRKITLALLAFATSALAADFTGNWAGEGVVNGESHPLYFVLKLDGNNLTGTGGPSATEQHPFEGGKVVGDKITFDVPVGQKGTIHFELKAD